MATSVEPLEKGVNRQSTIKYLSCSENLVKIGPVDSYNILLKVYFKKKLTEAKHIARRSG